MRVAAYVRVSTDEQADKGNSLFEQKERLQAYCKANGWEPPLIYEDDGYSAKDLRRPAITRLLDDVKKQKIDLVVTTKLDRLSRKLSDILNQVEFMKRNGSNYASTTQPFDTSTPQGMMMLQMLGAFAEFEREQISQRVRDNMRSLARNSNKAISQPCYGYTIVDGYFQVNIEEALVIRQMAEWLINGTGFRNVAKQLNEMGIRSKTGTHWSEITVRQLMQRETLVGKFVYNRTYRKHGKTLTRPREEWIVIDDHHEAILEDSVFDELQLSIQSRKQTNKHADNERYLLSGLVKCGHCGSPMIGKFLTKKKYPDYIAFRYLCSGYQKKGLCFHHIIDRDDIEQYVIDQIKLAAEGKTGELQMAETRSKNEANEKELLLARLRKLDQKMQKQIEAYEEDLITGHDLKLAKERIEDDRRSIQRALDEIDNADEANDQARVNKNAKRMLADVLSESRAVAKNAIRKLIHQVTITNGETVETIWRKG